MQSDPNLTVISLGGGVQSTVRALMASREACDRVADYAVLADTHWEPPSVYEHLQWLKGQLRSRCLALPFSCRLWADD